MDTFPLTKQGARTFPAIPEPTPDPQALAASASALKKAVETIIAMLSQFSTASGGTSSTASDGSIMTNAKVMSRISIGT